MEQIEAFWDGMSIGERTEGEFKIECRQISGFYVEYKILVRKLLCPQASNKSIFRNLITLLP
jgi:hypothetical protein